MVKYYIKDGFWCLECEQGEEWNFAYVLPQAEGEPVCLMVPTLLHKGWVESPPYFCAASEMARDVAIQYIDKKIGSLPKHKFSDLAMNSAAVWALPMEAAPGDELHYLLDVYVNDFIPMAIATSQQQLEHVSMAVMMGIHDVFPANVIDRKILSLTRRS